MIGEISAVGVLKMERFNKKRTGSRMGSNKVTKILLILELIGNHEAII